MKSKWIESSETYDGTQLHSLFAYLKHGLMGDSVVSWAGPCDVSFEHMVDGEDLLARSAIRGSRMLHFIFEIFDRDLAGGVLLQRLFAAIVKDAIEETAKISLIRQGDDLYWDSRKLSISIATRSPNSVMVHFAMNIDNAGTPVPTCALSEWGLQPQSLALELMSRVSAEYDSILQATYKVKSVP